MENEIKVGDFVRTNLGNIGKVIEEYTHRKGNVEYPEPQEWVLDTGYSLNEALMFESNEEIVKHSSNLIDIIEDEDFCKIEFYSPRYEKRGTRIFEASKIDEYITFENMHCDLFMKNGEWGNHDKRLNPVIKEIYTREMMESISYKVTKM